MRNSDIGYYILACYVIFLLKIFNVKRKPKALMKISKKEGKGILKFKHYKWKSVHWYPANFMPSKKTCFIELQLQLAINHITFWTVENGSNFTIYKTCCVFNYVVFILTTRFLLTKDLYLLLAQPAFWGLIFNRHPLTF